MSITIDAVASDVDDDGVRHVTAPLPPGIFSGSNRTFRVFSAGQSVNGCGAQTLDLDTPLPDPKGINITGSSFVDPANCGDDGTVTITLDNAANYQPPFSISVGGNTLAAQLVGNDLTITLGPGSYSNFVVEDNNGCQGTLSDQIDLFEPIAPEIVAVDNPEITIAENCVAIGSLTFEIIDDYSESGPFAISLDALNFSESSNDQEVTLADIPGGSYNQILIADNGGCRDTFVFDPPLQIAAEEAPVLEAFAMDSIDICENETFPIFAVADGGTGSLSFLWSLPGGGTVDEDSLLLAQGGTYTVTVTDSVGCSNSQEVTVSSLPLPTLIFNPSRVIQTLADSAVMISWTSSIPGTSYSWVASSPGNVGPFTESGTDTTISEIYTLADGVSQGEVTYLITATDGVCSTVDSIEVRIFLESGPEVFIIPDVFTPNGDGVNEFWDIRYPLSIDPETYSVKVYNRAGGLVHDRPLNIPWDGANLPDGAYYYIITNTTETSAMPQRGAVSLIRKQP